MEKREIREEVQSKIKEWGVSQLNSNQFNVSFTPKAIDFLCLIIENIQDDKSQFWKYSQSNSDFEQKRAISLIPKALDELLEYRRKIRIPRGQREVIISTWELYHSLSYIVDRFCFIPKNI